MKQITEHESNSCWEPTRVAIIDDHELIRTGLRFCLEKIPGYSVVFDVSTALEAYPLIPIHKPDAIVLDLSMPGEDGLTAIRRIRTQWPQPKIIVFTGSNDEKLVVQALLAGAHAFLRKDNSGREIVQAVKTTLTGKSYLCPTSTTVLINAFREKCATENSASRPGLTDRESTVLKRIAEGACYKEIADELGISIKSVETYRARVAEKLGCCNRAELVRYAVREGLVMP